VAFWSLPILLIFDSQVTASSLFGKLLVEKEKQTNKQKIQASSFPHSCRNWVTQYSYLAKLELS
jgi:hypothetical protein